METIEIRPGRIVDNFTLESIILCEFMYRVRVEVLGLANFARLLMSCWISFFTSRKLLLFFDGLKLFSSTYAEHAMHKVEAACIMRLHTYWINVLDSLDTSKTFANRLSLTVRVHVTMLVTWGFKPVQPRNTTVEPDARKPLQNNSRNLNLNISTDKSQTTRKVFEIMWR